MAATLCLPAVAGASPAAEQNSPRSPQSTQEAPAPRYRVLTVKEEHAIVNAAWDHRLSGDGVQDCSHVVNQVYSDAGYDYPYASSFDLYRGTPNFVRVKAPQPGDLIAWPGHVGIVLNARHHSFYSLVSTGLEAQNYRGAYWRGRGTPRFYRYVVERSTPEMATRTARAARGTELKIARTTREQDDTPELTAASVIERQIDKDSRLASGSRVGAQPRPEPSRGNAAPVETQPESAPTTSLEQKRSSSTPASIAIETANARPTRDEVAESILTLTTTAAEALAATDVLKSATPVIVLEQLSVERLDIKRDTGWAHLKIDSRVSIGADGVNFKARHDKVRWELRRGQSGWTATVPPDRRYVSREAAVRALSARLAQLSASDAAAQHDEAVLGQEARLANLLSALLANR